MTERSREKIISREKRSSSIAFAAKRRWETEGIAVARRKENKNEEEMESVHGLARAHLPYVMWASAPSCTLLKARDDRAVTISRDQQLTIKPISLQLVIPSMPLLACDVPTEQNTPAIDGGKKRYRWVSCFLSLLFYPLPRCTPDLV